MNSSLTGFAAIQPSRRIRTRMLMLFSNGDSIRTSKSVHQNTQLWFNPTPSWSGGLENDPKSRRPALRRGFCHPADTPPHGCVHGRNIPPVGSPRGGLMMGPSKPRLRRQNFRAPGFHFPGTPLHEVAPWMRIHFTRPITASPDDLPVRAKPPPFRVGNR